MVMFKTLPTCRFVEVGVQTNKFVEFWMIYGVPGWPRSCRTHCPGCGEEADNCAGPGAKVNKVKEYGGKELVKTAPATTMLVAMSWSAVGPLVRVASSCAMP